MKRVFASIGANVHYILTANIRQKINVFCNDKNRGQGYKIV